MASLAAALAVRDEAEIVWWRLSPPEFGGDAGTGGGGGFCEDIASSSLQPASS
jgi:hypothetical protein